MSNRDRARARRDGSIRDGSRRPRGGPVGGPGGEQDAPDAETRLERMTLALLPLRAFLGVTFVYAGVDKLIDPAFLQATGPGSIGSQMAEFVKVSPLAPLVQVFAQTFPVEIGLLIALAEIAVGLGALTGLLFRLAAAGGLALSLLFWLTASWATKPYYYGPDLPYAAGWLTLALAGTGGRYTVETWLARRVDRDDTDMPMSRERRLVLRAGVLGVAAIAVVAMAETVGVSVLGRTKAVTGGKTATATATTGTGTVPGSPSGPAKAGVPAGTVSSGANTIPAAASGPQIARVSQLTTGRAVAFDDPTTGDPGVLLKLPDGSIVAFDAVCTHAGCTVEYDRRSGFLLCPCHGAAFDPRNDAQAVAGPTNRPLAPVPIHVDGATGLITLVG
jgi:thiosulfate dehydrogenase (quinone) large subunit